MNKNPIARAVAAKLDENWDGRWYEETWTRERWMAAQIEGWNIWQCSGSDYGYWQICRIDEQDDENFRQLEDDSEAWLLVMNGHQEHQKLARWFIRDANPTHYREMQKFVRDQQRKTR